MITQYPWASVKKQERKYIEISMMITMLIATITLYSVPQFNQKVVVEAAYIPPPIDIIKVPVTVQPPEIVEPRRPDMFVGSDDVDMDDAILDDFFSFEPTSFGDLTPPAPISAEVPFWAVEQEPIPVGGWNVINQNVIYPSIAIEARQEGKVTVEALIGIDGIVQEVRVLKGLDGTGLNDAALAAVLMTPFIPAYQRDKPVAVRVAIPIEFRLR